MRRSYHADEWSGSKQRDCGARAVVFYFPDWFTNRACSWTAPRLSNASVAPRKLAEGVWCACARRGVLLRADGYGRLPLHTWWWRQFVFESSHGDRFYLGLNAIDLFDASGAPIRVPPHIVHALPHSVNDLLPPGADRDARIPSNLVAPLTSLEQRLDDRRAWLAPLAHSLHAGMVCMPPPHVLRAAVDMPHAARLTPASSCSCPLAPQG